MILWLASYPKSGNTWLRFFLLSLFLKDKSLSLSDLKNINQFPTKSQYEKAGININSEDLNEVSKYWTIVQKKINLDQKLRFFKTHNAYCKIANGFFTDIENTLGVIHIVRDPRNIISSIKNHYHHKKISESKNFIFDENKGVSVNTFGKKDFALPQVIGSWKTHFNSWKNIKKNYLLIKYENLINNPQNEFRKISLYIENLVNIKFTESQIQNAIDSSCFYNMQKKEEIEGFSESVIDPKTGKNKKFFFLGPKNDWRKIVDEKTIYEINKKFKLEMKELGYI